MDDLVAQRDRHHDEAREAELNRPEAELIRLEAELSRREHAVAARDVALAQRMEAAHLILAAADERDAISDSRDIDGDTRDQALDRAHFLATGSTYGDDLPLRRGAALDRQHAKGDREASHEDRVALTKENEAPEGS